MSSLRLHALAICGAVALAACGASQRPQLKVLGVENNSRTINLYVEVTNNATRPMKLQRLDYAFGPSSDRGTDTAHGQVALSRTIEGGSAVVVEVPIDVDPDLMNDVSDLQLRGNLIAEQDSVLRAYPVTAAVDDQQPATP